MQLFDNKQDVKTCKTIDKHLFLLYLCHVNYVNSKNNDKHQYL